MSLQENIDSDIVSSMKSKDEETVSVLRMLKSAIHNFQIASKKEPQDADIVGVIQEQIKSRKDSIGLYRKGNRQELADKEQKEIEILSKYLPEQMSEDDISAVVKKAVAETDATSIQDMGKVMGKVMPELKGKADGSMVSEVVKSELSK